MSDFPVYPWKSPYVSMSPYVAPAPSPVSQSPSTPPLASPFAPRALVPGQAAIERGRGIRRPNERPKPISRSVSLRPPQMPNSSGV